MYKIAFYKYGSTEILVNEQDVTLKKQLIRMDTLEDEEWPPKSKGNACFIWEKTGRHKKVSPIFSTNKEAKIWAKQKGYKLGETHYIANVEDKTK